MIMQLVITFFGWLALMYASINLIGMLVRGLVLVSDVEKQLSEGDDNLKKVAGEIYHPKLERKVNITAAVLIVIYLGALFYFWNIGVVIVAAILMVSRIPDLLWEIKYGRRKIKEMPSIYMITTLVTLATLPILWFSLYQL